MRLKDFAEASYPKGWLVDGLLPQGHSVLGVGLPGTLKSWFVDGLAVHIASGGDFLGQPVNRGPVILVDEDTPSDELLNRLERLAKGLNLSLGDLPIEVHSMENINLSDDEYESRLKNVIGEEAEFTEQQSRLSRFTPAEEPPKPEDVRRALRALQSESPAWHKTFCILLAKATPIIKIALAKGEERDKLIQELQDLAEKLIEKWDIKVIVSPGDGGQQFKLDVLVNIPIKKQEVKECVMVSPTS
jgi:hypothetical protein